MTGPLEASAVSPGGGCDMTGPLEASAVSPGGGCDMSGPLEASAVSTFSGRRALGDVSPASEAAGTAGGGLTTREGAVA